MVRLSLRELDTLMILWRFHRSGCDSQKDVIIQHSSGGGIGTVTKAKCGCGKELDITDYESW